MLNMMSIPMKGWQMRGQKANVQHYHFTVIAQKNGIKTVT